MEEGIRTTANSVAKSSLGNWKNNVEDYKNTKSRYLISGVIKGEKYEDQRKKRNKNNESQLTIRQLDFNTMRFKSKS